MQEITFPNILSKFVDMFMWKEISNFEADFLSFE